MNKLDQLRQELEHLTKSLGVRYFGVADLTPARDFIVQQGGDFLGEYRYGVALGYPLATGYVDMLPYQNSRAALTTYRFMHHHVDHWLDMVNVQVSCLIENAGYKALPVPTDEIMDRTQHLSVFSLKIPFHLAGLGWMGKNNLVITPEIGPRLRLGAVLTSAPMAIFASGTMASQCGDCQICVEACPIGALSGKDFDPNEDREARVDVNKCVGYRREREKEQGAFVCGLCMYACKYRRK
ncbi:4Fe-4S double cluster binding domain-containing protein [Chloroflexota bacterium]